MYHFLFHCLGMLIFNHSHIALNILILFSFLLTASTKGSIEVMDHSPFKLNLHFCKKIKIFYHSMSKLVTLPRLMAKCCKIRKIYACEVCKFCTLLYYAYKMAEIHRKFGHFVVSVIQKYTKFANLASVYFPCFTIFRHQTWQFY